MSAPVGLSVAGGRCTAGRHSQARVVPYLSFLNSTRRHANAQSSVWTTKPPGFPLAERRTVIQAAHRWDVEAVTVSESFSGRGSGETEEDHQRT
jgi:hypothetical protein